MAFQLTMGMTYNGREPEVLSDLIMRRQKVLGETADKAVIGTAISVMTSLRAQTKVADEKKIEFSKIDVPVRWVTRNKRRTIEVNGAPLNKKMRRIFKTYEKGQPLMCYRATVYVSGEKESFTLVCQHESQVVGFLRKRVIRYKRMARSAWGHLMRMTSQREATIDPITTQATNILRNNLTVQKGGSQYEFGVRVIDDLRYAGGALKGGPASVTHAMQAASNKIAGQIRRFIADNPRFAAQNINTPFPEIVKPR